MWCCLYRMPVVSCVLVYHHRCAGVLRSRVDAVFDIATNLPHNFNARASSNKATVNYQQVPTAGETAETRITAEESRERARTCTPLHTSHGGMLYSGAHSQHNFQFSFDFKSPLSSNIDVTSACMDTSAFSLISSAFNPCPASAISVSFRVILAGRPPMAASIGQASWLPTFVKLTTASLCSSARENSPLLKVHKTSGVRLSLASGKIARHPFASTWARTLDG